MNFTHAESAVIALTAATVVLGAVALVLAIVGIWGYRNIKDGAIQFASKKIGEEMEKQLKSAGKGGAFDKAVQRALKQTVYGSPQDDQDNSN